VVKHSDKGESLVALILQNRGHKVFVLFRETRLEPDNTFHNFVTDFTRMDSSEWSSSVDKLVK